MAVPTKAVEARCNFKRVLRIGRYVAIGTISLSEREVQLPAEKPGLGRGMRIVTTDAIGLDYRITFVGRLKPVIALVTCHAIAATRPFGKMSEGRGVRLVTGGALVATERRMSRGTGLPVRYLRMTRRAELGARRKQQVVMGAAVRRVAPNAATLRNRPVYHLERELFLDVLMTLQAKRPGAIAQQPREPRDVGLVTSSTVAVSRGHVRHAGGELRLQIVVTGEADLLLVDLLDGAGTSRQAQRQQEAPHRSPQ